ncbi:MAG: N-6 DNA methylase [Alphaproteobacteria bacterium]|jgi:tRNA1(Val) A37 N6-methylase TrmN6|nr:N-6 DNA methylase [Alphaproteobacteria bacterium]
MAVDQHRKGRGAYFTPPAIADYLAAWAIRAPADSVLEPGCGEAGFLLAAARRLAALGAPNGLAAGQLTGVEVYSESADRARALLAGAGVAATVRVEDFFEHPAERRYDVVLGNPPFVRYQNFAGRNRARGLEAALAQGIRLSGLASSWASFLIKTCLHLQPEGRLALVLPAELLSVSYAKEVRRFLLERFQRVRLILFEERVFPGVLEEVVLLLAEGSGGARCIEVHQARDVGALPPVETAAWVSHAPAGHSKWTDALLEREAFALYDDLRARSFEPLSAWGRTYLGAVTGRNDFFALSLAEAERLGLSERDTLRISPPGTRHLRGPAFTEAGWTEQARRGARGLLLYPPDTPSPAARRYIAEGEARGVADAYKCRVRRPWWRVPLVPVPDLFLTYMNHDRPRLVANAAQAQILNSLYGVTLQEGRKTIGRALLPLACLNSLTLLGCELVGRAYGGGLLKMEPREADRLPLPSLALLKNRRSDLQALKPRLAALLQGGRLADAVEAVDAVVLADVPVRDRDALRLARAALFGRRRARGQRAGG